MKIYSLFATLPLIVFSSPILLTAEESFRWDAFSESVMLPTFFPSIPCLTRNHNPCGCIYQDVFTFVKIDCSPGGFFTDIALISVNPNNQSLLVHTEASSLSSMPLLRSFKSSLPYLCRGGSHAFRCEWFAPFPFWTSLREQLGQDSVWPNACHMHVHPCLCLDCRVVSGDDDFQVFPTQGLNLSNFNLSGVISFSQHDAWFPSPPDSLSVSTPLLVNLKHNPELVTHDFSPFSCVVFDDINREWQFDSDFPFCRDTDLGVWWEIMDSTVQLSSVCSNRNDPCTTCPDTVLRCRGNSIVFVNLLGLDFDVSNPSLFLGLSQLEELYLDANDDDQPCVEKPLWANIAIGNFCKPPRIVVRKLGCDNSTVAPTLYPTRRPTKIKPTHSPTLLPSRSPSIQPSRNPVTRYPSKAPKTRKPTSHSPTTPPSASPTFSPSFTPSLSPSTHAPSSHPTHAPSLNPTPVPSLNPTRVPSLNPRVPSTLSPSRLPTTKSPSAFPSSSPSQSVAPTPFQE